MQVLHSNPELGGDAVHKACGDSPGVYVGKLLIRPMLSHLCNMHMCMASISQVPRA